MVASLAFLVACEERHLVGDGLPPGQEPGTGGSRTASGTGGASGGGSGGVPVVAQPVPLRISPQDALVRMTQLLWQGPPDGGMTAPAAGSIETTAALLPFARSIVEDPRTIAGVGAFYRWWLGLDALATAQKDPGVFPELTAELALSMAAETETFGTTVTLEGAGFFSTLFLAPYSYIDEGLAGIYGVPGVSGAALRRIPLDPAQRSGLLTQPALAVLASGWANNVPTRRGRLVLDRFLCDVFPPPPPGEELIGPVPPNTSLRTAIGSFVPSSACAACHAALDPVGFAFEGIDAIGRVRNLDNGAPIDTSGMLRDRRTFNGVAGAEGLSALLASDATAQRCMAQHWLEFAVARALSAADDPSIDAATRAFHESGDRLRDLIAAVLTSEAFLSP